MTGHLKLVKDFFQLFKKINYAYNINDIDGNKLYPYRMI